MWNPKQECSTLQPQFVVATFYKRNEYSSTMLPIKDNYFSSVREYESYNKMANLFTD